MYYNSAFVQYAKSLSLSKYDPIKIEEEREYLLKYRREGCIKSFKRLVEANLRFVIYALRRMSVPSHIDSMDLVQEGVLGLIAGIEKYDIDKFNVRVSTYAISWIRFFISQQIIYYQGDKHLTFSYYQDVESSDNGDRRKGDIKEIKDPEDCFAVSTEESNRMIMEHVLGSLPPREKSILVLYFGLEYPYKRKPLQEIGVMMHLNFERVRQLKDQALKSLQSNSNISNLLAI